MLREEINFFLSIFFKSNERRFLLDFVDDNQICFCHILEPSTFMVTFMEDGKSVCIDTDYQSINISRTDISELIAVSYMYTENLFDYIDEMIKEVI